MKKLVSVTGIIAATLIFTAMVHATTVPSFPSCLNPSGTVTSQYVDGVHGIVGDSNAHTGSDTVYTVSNDLALQCFCPPEQTGIQTNWWKVSDLSEYEVKELETQGWVYVPTGSVWGLSNEAYMAKNMAYSCLGGKGGGGSTSGSGGSSGSSTGTGGSSSESGNSVGPGLASTGTLYSIVNLTVPSLLLLIGGYLVRKGTRS